MRVLRSSTDVVRSTYKRAPRAFVLFATLALFTALAALAISTAPKASAVVEASPSTPGGSSSSIESMSLADKTQSYVLLNALRACIKDGANKLPSNSNVLVANNMLTEAQARKGTWFYDYSKDQYFSGSNFIAKPYVKPASWLSESIVNDTETYKDGRSRCNTIAKSASSLWGYASPFDLFCSFVDTRWGGEGSCKTGTGNFGSDETTGSDRAEKLYTAVKKKVYGGNTPSLKVNDGYPGRYLLFKSAFFGACSPKENNSPPSGRDYKVTMVDDQGNKKEVTYEGADQDTKVYAYTSIDLTELQYTCRQLAEKMNENAQAYSSYARANPSESSEPTNQWGSGSDEEGPSSCQIDGIGWIVCPVVNLIGNLTDGAYSVIAELLETQPSMFNRDSDEGKATYAAWSVMRNIANIAFVIAFMIIIYSQLTGAGISNYGVKKMLPRLIIAAILVNASFYICALAVDISNIAGFSLKTVIDNISNDVSATIGDSVMYGADTGSNLWANLAGWVLVAGGLAVATVYLGLTVFLPIAISALAAAFTAVVVLTLRQALVILLIVIAPLAFVALILPNTEGLFKKWKSLSITLLAMFPAVALIFGVSALAGKIVMLSSDSIIVQIAGAGITLIPLFVTPILMRTAGGLLNRFAGVVNNPNKGVFDRMRRGADGMRKNSAYVRGREARKQLRQSRKNRNFSQQYESGRQLAEAIADKNSKVTLRTDENGEAVSAVEVAQRAAALRAYHSARGPAALVDAPLNAASDWAKSKDNELVSGIGTFTQFATGSAGRREDRDELSDVYQVQNEKATQEAIKDIEVAIKLKTPDMNLTEMGEEFKKAIEQGDDVRGRALQNMMLKSGGAGVQQFYNSMSELEQSTEPAAVAGVGQTIKALKANVKDYHPGVKASAADVMNWATNREFEKKDADGRVTGRMPGTLANATTQQSWANMPAEEFATQKPQAQKRALALNAVTPENALKIVSTPQLEGKLEPGVRSELQKLAGTAKAPAASLVMPSAAEIRQYGGSANSGSRKTITVEGVGTAQTQSQTQSQPQSQPQNDPTQFVINHKEQRAADVAPTTLDLSGTSAAEPPKPQKSAGTVGDGTHNPGQGGKPN